MALEPDELDRKFMRYRRVRDRADRYELAVKITGVLAGLSTLFITQILLIAVTIVFGWELPTLTTTEAVLGLWLLPSVTLWLFAVSLDAKAKELRRQEKEMFKKL